jgi:hypothetical protein
VSNETDNIYKEIKMQKEQQYVSRSIDKVLSYIERDINDPSKEDVVENLVDIHAFLTKIKSRHVVKNSTKKSLSTDLLLYSNMISDAFNVVFGEWDANITIVDDRVIVCNDIVYMDINMDNDVMECIISFHKNANPVIVAEVSSILRDMFGIGFKVSGEVFVVDESDHTYVWGEEDIMNYIKRVNGIKVKPILWFENEELGNC